jgi:outer membrane receptor for ferrienterochelin and colicins
VFTQQQTNSPPILLLRRRGERYPGRNSGPILRLTLIFFGLAFGSNPLFAQPATIKGRVAVKNSSEFLAGVNVLLQGTTRGVATNMGGEFQFTDVRPGTYGLSFSLVGYQRETRPEIVVGEDETVELQIELTPVPIQGEPVIVTANKRGQSMQDVPVSVSTMDAASIARRNIVTLDDALRFVPGVNLTEWQVNIRGSSGYSRGAGSRVLLLVDGIPFTTGDTGELNFESFPAGQVERVEVVKGAGSALYGSSALGGVINVITKRIPDQPETRIRTYGGFYSGPSYSNWDWGGGTRFLDGQSFSHSRTFEDAGLLVFGSRASDDGFRQNDYRRRYNGYVKAYFNLSSYDALTTTFSILHQNRGSFLYWKDIAHALVPPDVQQGDIVKSTRFFWSGLYTHTFSSAFIYAVKAMWYHNKWDDTIDTLTNSSRSDVLRAEIQTTWSPSTTNVATFGIEGSTDNVNADLFGKRSGYGAALYAQDEFEIIPALKATIGARFDLSDMDSLESTSQINPKLGLVYFPIEGMAVRASSGRGFRAPAVAEAFTNTAISGLPIIPNPNLKPERSWTYEIGASQTIGSSAWFDLAFFQSDFDGLIESGFTAQLQGQFRNVTKARIQGMEASARFAMLGNALLFDLGYTYVSPKDLTKNDILKYRPRHLLYVNGLTQFGMFNVGADFRYISRVERIDDEFVTLGIVKNGDQRVATYIADLRFGADFSRINFPLIAQFNINNIFQYNYVELIGNIASPRNIVLTLEARL